MPMTLRWASAIASRLRAVVSRNSARRLSAGAGTSVENPGAQLVAARRELQLPWGTFDQSWPSSRRDVALRVGSTLLDSKRNVVRGLAAIYGVGYFQAQRLCATAGINERLKVAELSDNDIERISAALKELSSDERREADGPIALVHGEALREAVRMDIERLILASTYRGIRHKSRLPVRGQRTRTNAKTARKRVPPNVKAGAVTE